MAEEYIGGAEAERRASSIAEMNVTELIQDLVRQVSDSVREAFAIFKNLSEGRFELVKASEEKVRNLKINAEEKRQRIMEYLVRVSPTLYNKDLFMYIASDVERIAQLMNGAVERMAMLAKKKKLPLKETANLLSEMVEKIIEEYEALLAATRMLLINPKKSIEDAHSAVKIEDEIDSLYRNLELHLYETYTDDLVTLMLLKEIIDMFEDTADKIRSAADNVKYIALHKV